MTSNQHSRVFNMAERVPFVRGFTREGTADLVDLGFIIDVLRREKRLIQGMVIGTLILAVILVMRLPAVYTASALLLLETRQERVLGPEQVVSNLTVSPAVLGGELELIRSSMLIGRVVDELGLTDHPDYDPRKPDGGAVRSAIRGLRSVLGGAARDADQMSDDDIRAATIARLQRNIVAAPAGMSFSIRVSVKASAPDLAAKIANTVADQYVAALLAVKRDAAVRASGWLEERIADLSRQLEQADSAVVAFRTRMTEQLGGDAEATAQLLADLNSRYIATRIEHSDASFRYQMVQNLNEAGGLSAVADVVSSPLLETLAQQRAGLLRERAEMTETLGDRNRGILGISAQIADIERSIDAELQRQMESIRSQMEIATHREQALLSAMEEIQQRQAQVSSANVTLDQLERSAEALRQTYSASLARFMETAAQADFQRPEAQVISPARPPSSASEPRKALLLALATFFGLTSGVAVAFVREALNTSIRSSESMRKISDLPIISILPYVPDMMRDRKRFIQEVSSAPQSQFMEAIRAIRVKLFDVRDRRRPKVLTITSSVAGEGKTTTSLMLAHSLSKMSLAVIVVDSDLRRSVSPAASGADPKGGCLVDFLTGKTRMAAAIQHLPDLGIDVLLPLRTVPNPGDLITSKRFSDDLIKTLSAHYDVVIIDTAPVLAAPDVLFISSISDATLMLVQTSHAPGKAVQEALQRLEEAGATVVGNVLSQVHPKDDISAEGYEYAKY